MNMRSTQVYIIETDGHRQFYEKNDPCNITLTVPQRRAQEVIDAVKRSPLYYCIIRRMDAVTDSPFIRQSCAKIRFRISGSACYIFELLNLLNIHQHYGENYIDNGSNFRIVTRPVEKRFKAYYKLNDGRILSQLVDTPSVASQKNWHNAKKIHVITLY